MSRPSPRIAVVGAGLIGERHARLIAADPALELAAVVDPATPGAALAATLGSAHHATLDTLLSASAGDVHGVVVATPNQTHLEIATRCIERGLPVLVEKPLADTLEAGAALVAASARHGVPVLVGHHRRYNPRVELARDIIASGELGRLVGVSALWAACKPAEYFEVSWRRQPGGGPVLINLIHDIDCLRHLCGEIDAVQAFGSHARRGLAVEDGACISIRFADGALGSVLLTDAAPSPWSWEAGSADNPGIAASAQNCYRFLGSEAALDFPNLTVWRMSGGALADWGNPMCAEYRAAPPGEALQRQLHHFAAVIAGDDAARIDAADGFATLAATLAVHRAMHSGQPVRPAELAARAQASLQPTSSS